MKAKSIILTLVIAAPGICPGATLSPQEALDRAVGEFPVHKVKSRLSADSLIPVPAITKMVSGEPALYVFNASGGCGFMVVSADDATPALLGYSDAGVSPSDEAVLPDGFRYWLDFLTSRVGEARSSGYGETHRINRPDRQSIAPLCSTKWDQTEPFNILCPEQCPTGCVATAMAQVMKSHDWPLTGTGSHSYEWNQTTLSSDFSSVTFDWADMIDCYEDGSYTSRQADAVALLMAQAGISVDMVYNSRSSGAMVISIAPALAEYFKYDKGKINTIYRPLYTLNEWEDIIYSNLVDYGPVIYNGVTDRGGAHCFVCDGYDGDGFFHINWGWGGLSDGYFLLDVLNPVQQGTGGYQNQSGFCFEQGVIVGITPDYEGNSEWAGHFISTAQLVIDSDGTYSVGDQVPVYVKGQNSIYNSGPGTFSANTELGLLFVSMQSGERYIEPVCVGQEVPMMAGIRGYYFPIPENLEDGQYVAYLVYRDNGEEWQKVAVPVFDSQDFLVTVKDGKVEFKPSQYIRLQGSRLVFPSEVYDLDLATGLEFDVACKITNPSGKSFYSYLQPLIIDGDYNVVAYGNERVISIDAGETVEYQEVTPFHGFKSGCGDYLMVLTTRTSYTYEIIAYMSVKVVSFYGEDGVESVGADDASGECVYFDMMGRRVDNPRPGTLVIKKQGDGCSRLIMSR